MMRETKPLHVTMKHGRSFVTGEEIEFYEAAEPTERAGLIRRMLGWPTKQATTMYPATDATMRGVHETESRLQR